MRDEHGDESTDSTDHSSHRSMLNLVQLCVHTAVYCCARVLNLVDYSE
jgi:hypothetical protein